MNLSSCRERRRKPTRTALPGEVRASGDDEGADKYRAVSFIDAMRQAALWKWMTPVPGHSADVDEAFGFARVDASEPYYAAISALAFDVARTLSDEHGKPIAVLDVGAGVGRVAYDLARTEVASEVVALEKSPELAGEIEALASGDEREVFVPVTGTKTLRAVLRPPSAAKRLTVACGDACCIPFSSAEFSLALCLGLVDRVQHPRLLAGELARVLRPGGAAIVSCLHDFAGGPARRDEWVRSVAELFTGAEWTPGKPRRQKLDLRQNAYYMESFNAEIVVAWRW